MHIGICIHIDSYAHVMINGTVHEARRVDPVPAAPLAFRQSAGVRKRSGTRSRPRAGVCISSYVFYVSVVVLLCLMCFVICIFVVYH